MIAEITTGGGGGGGGGGWGDSPTIFSYAVDFRMQ